MVVIELDESLHAIDFFVHFSSYIGRLVFFPFPKCNLLLVRSGCLAQWNYQSSVFVYIEGEYSLWMRIENSFPRRTRVNIPYNEHRIFPHVRSHYDIELSIVCCCADLVAMSLQLSLKIVLVIVNDTLICNRDEDLFAICICQVVDPIVYVII